MKVRITHIFTFLLLCPGVLAAQQYNFQTYSVNKGLPHAQVHDVFQTSDGFIWIATSGGGLAKFDGKSFEVYNTRDGLRSNIIEVVFEDSRQNLWVSTYGKGIARMENNHFIYPFKNSALDSLTVTVIDEMDSKLWIGTIGGGFFIYSYEDGELSRITKKDGLINNTVWDFWKAPDGRIWIATQGGISVYDDQEFKSLTKSDGLSGSKTFKIAAHPNGDIWIATNNGVTIKDGEQFKRLNRINNVPLNYVFDLIVTSNGAVWIGTELEGVFVLEDGAFTHFTTENGLSSNYIYSLYEDNQQNVWIGTDSDGVNLLKGMAFKFFHTKKGQNSNMILSLQRDENGRLWAGTYNGIFYREEGKFMEFPLPEKYKEPKEVWDIAEFKNGDLLFLMPDNALYRWDGEQLTNYSQKHGLDLWYTYDIYIDKNNTLWIGTDQGLFHYSHGKIKHYTTQEGLVGNVILHIYEFNGYFWIGTYNGLSRFNGHSFKNFSIKDGLGHKKVSHIAADEKGNIWLGTSAGVSLLKLDEQGNLLQIENFGKETGMKLVNTQIIWFDAQGYLWQGTNGGIHKLDVPDYWKSGEMLAIHYPLSSWGIGVEVNHKALVSISENEALFGTMEGILKISPSQLGNDNTNLPVYITQIERNGQPLGDPINVDSIDYKFGRPVFPHLQFPYGQQRYTFHFRALEYKYPESVRYHYHIKGSDEGWSAETSTTSATFRNLDAGEYEFEVHAKGPQGKWSTQTASVTFTVESPFWQTYWFYGLMGITFVGLISGFIQLRLQILEKKRLKQLVDEQTKDLTDALKEKEVLIKEIHHRVKNNLAVISGLLELQVGYSKDDFAAKILRESQRRVQSISMIHEKLYQNERLSEINFAAYIDELTAIIADSHNRPDKTIKVETKIDEVKLGVNQGVPCGLILNELLSNAFEHAFKDQEKGKIIIRFKEDDGKIEFSVEDNGIGLPPDFESMKMEAKSLGIILVETLTQQLEGELSIERLDKGTRFKVTFVKENALQSMPV